MPIAFGFAKAALTTWKGRKPPAYDKNAWNRFATHLFGAYGRLGIQQGASAFPSCRETDGPLAGISRAEGLPFRNKPPASCARARQDKTMFQFTLGREFAVVFGAIGIAAVIWAAWVLETPGLLPL
jgi:hypothetical protein